MNKRAFVIVAALIVVVLLIVGVYYWWGRRGEVEDWNQIIEDKNIALGYMESSKFDEAIPRLRHIIARLPDDPLGYRNLVIALFAPTDKGDTKHTFEGLEPAVAAVQQLLEIDGLSPVTHILAGRIYRARAELARGKGGNVFTDALTKAREHFQEAGRLAPNDPAPFYEIYDLERRLGDPDRLSDEGYQALQTATTLAPQNLVCLTELLEQRCERDDRQAVEVARKLEPLLSEEEGRGGADPRKDLQAIIRLLADHPPQTPPEVFQRINSLKTQLQQHSSAYQRDLARLKPHPLELMLHDFKPSFYAQLPPPLATEGIPVHFALVAVEPLAGDDIAAIAYADVDSRSHFAFFLLRRRDRGCVIETRRIDGTEVIAPIEIDGAFGDMQPADIDLDIQPPPADGEGNVPADIDLVLFGGDGIRILENRAEGDRRRWVDRTADSKLPKLTNVRWVQACDIDHDGNLDLVVGTAAGLRLFRNSGAWVFADITDRSPGLAELKTVAGVFGDWDRDGDIDLIVLREGGSATVLVNHRSGRFRVGDAIAECLGPRAVTVLDANNDGRLDLLIGHERGATLRMSGEDGTILDRTAESITLATAAPVSQVGAFDYDNDGWTDFYLLTENPDRPIRLYRNRHVRQFVDRSDIVAEAKGKIARLIDADLDSDGDLDLASLDNDGVAWLRNDGGNTNHWLDFRLRALLSRDAGSGEAAKSNYLNIGGTIEVRAGRRYQFRLVTRAVTHFGLGRQPQVDVARIVWTNGVPQTVIRPQPDQIHSEEQEPKGSCPFLFAWNGERFVFVTDCLWSSALGMKLADGVFMDHRRQHNYLVVPGDMLQPIHGEYVLQFTNELWEVPYLDQVELWVVDHPAEVSIYTNQRIPPNPDEPFRIVTATDKRVPVAAKDHRGRDVLATVSRRDGRFVGGFRRFRYYGLAEPHYLELDLGDLSRARRATLFLTGWIWPTDTTANVAISQDPRFRRGPAVIGGARPPSLLVPDGRGGWKTTIPMMGFQSGKMQTVAVDLPLDQFPTGDYRVRVATQMELYWDEVFFTVDEPEVKLEMHRLPVRLGHLHYRGYSRMWQESPTSPHWFLYERPDPTPRWLPIPGPYSRYGPVTEFLHEPDLRYVVMSPGDELTLKFASLPPPSSGRKRTFLFYANGWLKDFDMNGGASERVLPLPFDGMSRYPYGPDEQIPPSLQEYRQQHLTREVVPARFWDLLR